MLHPGLEPNPLSGKRKKDSREEREDTRRKKKVRKEKIE